jgi:hypothetical protein
MTTEKDIAFRLLKLYPIKVIKDYFSLKSVKQDQLITNIVEKNNFDVLKKFGCENISYTKQHVYLFNHNIKNLSKLPDSLFTEREIYKCNKISTEVNYFYFLKTAYSVILLSKSIEPVKIPFVVPLRVSINKDILCIAFTKIEKNISSYLASESQIHNNGKDMDEENICEQIITKLNLLGKVEICDINKGIKKIWNSDFIDAISVKYKDSCSTNSVAMDEEFTYKEKYPNEFQQTMNDPLKKTVFKIIDPKIFTGTRFTVEPCEGRINFPTFAKQIDEKEYVIRKILENN